MSFYLGKFLVQDTPVNRNFDWCFPESVTFEHSKETSNPQELNIFPENLELEPEETQAGACKWVLESAPLSGGFILQTSPGLGGFYVIGPPAIGGFYIEGLIDC